MAEISFENALKSVITGVSEVTTRSGIVGSYLPLFNSSGECIGKVSTERLLSWAGGSSSSS